MTDETPTEPINPTLTFDNIVSQMRNITRTTPVFGIDSFPFQHRGDRAQQTEALLNAARTMFDFEAREYLERRPEAVAINPLSSISLINPSHMFNRLHNAISRANRRRTYT